MRTEDAICLWCDLELRQHIVDMAKRLTRIPALQAALIGHAWFILGEADNQRTVKYYKDLCACVMYRERDLYRYNEKRLTRMI